MLTVKQGGSCSKEEQVPGNMIFLPLHRFSNLHKLVHDISDSLLSKDFKNSSVCCLQVKVREDVRIHPKSLFDLSYDSLRSDTAPRVLVSTGSGRRGPSLNPVHPV